MEKYLYIDDIRDPKTDKDWKVVRSSDQAINYFLTHGCPNYISFDHDLGGEDTSMKIVKFMIDLDINDKGEFIPDDFEFNVHSANPIGAENIKGTLNSYFKQKLSNTKL